MAELDRLKEALIARTGRGAQLGLSRMGRALDALGRPDRRLAVVHVAGTNGKGSTCAFIESIARAAGLRTGLYSSPHLCRLNERIRVDGAPLDDELLGDALERALAVDSEPTFFEVMTLAAFVAFRGVDLAILEVGLGGRLDATNVVAHPLCTAITTIALDHTPILGSSLAEIAGEKAGIIKAGAPLVVGPLEPEARKVIQARAQELGAPFIEASEGAGDALALSGAHQRDNASVARAIVTQLPTELGIGARHIEEGLTTACWPGRLETLRQGLPTGVTVLLDCAHNPHAVQALARATANLRPERTRLVFGAMEDKAWADMLAELGPRAHSRYYCEPLPELAGRKPARPSDLAGAFPGTALATPVEAISRALADAAPGETILVTGSIFLVGAVRGHLLGIAPDIMVPL